MGRVIDVNHSFEYVPNFIVGQPVIARYWPSEINTEAGLWYLAYITILPSNQLTDNFTIAWDDGTADRGTTIPLYHIDPSGTKRFNILPLSALYATVQGNGNVMLTWETISWPGTAADSFAFSDGFQTGTAPAPPDKDFANWYANTPENLRNSVLDSGSPRNLKSMYNLINTGVWICKTIQINKENSVINLAVNDIVTIYQSYACFPGANSGLQNTVEHISNVAKPDGVNINSGTSAGSGEIRGQYAKFIVKKVVGDFLVVKIYLTGSENAWTVIRNNIYTSIEDRDDATEHVHMPCGK